MAEVIAPTAVSPNINSFGNASASAYFKDVLLFNVPGAAPQAMFSATAQLHFDALTTAGGSMTEAVYPSFFDASSSWTTRVSMASGLQGWLFQDERGQQCSGVSALPTCTGNTPGTFTVHFNVLNQTNIVFEMSATSRTVAGVAVVGTGYGSAGASNDMSNTLAWDGLLQVWDNQGNEVSDYSFVGLGTGFDFRQSTVSAVPEPRSWLMLLVGMAILGLLVQRRRNCAAAN